MYTPTDLRLREQARERRLTADQIVEVAQTALFAQHADIADEMRRLPPSSGGWAAWRFTQVAAATDDGDRTLAAGKRALASLASKFLEMEERHTRHRANVGVPPDEVAQVTALVDLAVHWRTAAEATGRAAMPSYPDRCASYEKEATQKLHRFLLEADAVRALFVAPSLDNIYWLAPQDKLTPIDRLVALLVCALDDLQQFACDVGVLARECRRCFDTSLAAACRANDVTRLNIIRTILDPLVDLWSPEKMEVTLQN